MCILHVSDARMLCSTLPQGTIQQHTSNLLHTDRSTELPGVTQSCWSLCCARYGNAIRSMCLEPLPAGVSALIRLLAVKETETWQSIVFTNGTPKNVRPTAQQVSFVWASSTAVPFSGCWRGIHGKRWVRWYIRRLLLQELQMIEQRFPSDCWFFRFEIGKALPSNTNHSLLNLSLDVLA